ncbi:MULTISPECIES: NAD-dependent epimerase/dehydratase family protein [unclassified Janthinobacterium]|uniref:NAD-dependent epimerase/dehydratase family protein n=1 Tax=unclassified Janthinobacterium TaxID=2610881 RepID=UPI0008841F00|nr:MULTISPECIES: NAD-dependent epimerase/dehydratase family protein [unclassified Janthinobacterium]SDA82021.1 dTDP-L-rhamnose 4-epimerase [Janthinobacterium sp. 551a]SFB64646.1 dTDP-L-rhamnose 4-epimerase [Janthinobacterium sp. 344]
MNILITGGAGFIGSNLALHLIDLGHEITVLDNLSPQIHGSNPEETSPLYRSIKDKVRFVAGTVCDDAAWREVLPGQHAIVHLAAETGTGQSMYEIKRYVDINIGGTGLMLDLLANTDHQVKKVVVASSRSIYGEGKYFSETLGIVYPCARKESDMKAGNFDLMCAQSGEVLKLLATDEESKIHPSSVYGITKQNQEQMVLTVCKSLNIGAIALRYQNVYGPGQSLSNPYTGILSIFSTRIKNGNGINIFEDGKESRDFVYIDDIVRATTAALLADEVRDEVFGIGAGIATDVLTVAETLVRNYGVEVPITVTGAFRIGDIRHNFADLSKANRMLGFSPQVSFDEGIRNFSAWVDQQEVQVDTYDASIAEMSKRGLFK